MSASVPVFILPSRGWASNTKSPVIMVACAGDAAKIVRFLFSKKDYLLPAAGAVKG